MRTTPSTVLMTSELVSSNCELMHPLLVPELPHRQQRVLEAGDQPHIAQHEAETAARGVFDNHRHVTNEFRFVLETVRGLEALAVGPRVDERVAVRRQRSRAAGIDVPADENRSQG